MCLSWMSDLSVSFFFLSSLAFQGSLYHDQSRRSFCAKSRMTLGKRTVFGVPFSVYIHIHILLEAGKIDLAVLLLF